jgi:Ca2+-binding RTX toxin-like protein
VSGPGASTALDADDRLIFNQSTGDLYYDPDGTGSADATVVATLTGGATLHASDIVIV